MRGEPAAVIIFGAAVLPDGRPSPALARRIECAVRLADPSPGFYFIVTGGMGRFPPSEAEVMRDELIRRGIPASQILADDRSRNTRESILEVARILRSLPTMPRSNFVATDTYHEWRCRFLLRLLGVRTQHAKLSSGFAANGFLRWSFYYLREALAIPKDVFMLVLHECIDGG